MLFLIGALAGFAYGFSAFGGSVLAVALLAQMLGLPIADAMAMNLCMLVVLATITAGDGVRARLPVPGSIWPFALMAVIGAPIGVWLSTGFSEPLLASVLPALLVVLAIGMMILVQRMEPAMAWPRGGLAAMPPLKVGEETPRSITWSLPVIGGGMGGLFAGLLGASGTLFLVPALARVFPKRAGQAVACAEMAMLPALLIAVVASLALERAVPWRATGLMIFGALAGLSLARMLAPKIGPRVCHFVVALSLVATAIWMLLSSPLAS